MPRSTSAVAAALAAALATVLVAVLTACGSSSSIGTSAAAGPAASAQPVDVSVSDCGSAWKPTAAGDQVLTLHNADAVAGEVQLIGRGAHSDLVYADIEPFGAGTTVEVNVPLAAGSYALACLMEDKAPVTGPTRTITGDGAGTPGVDILTQSQLVPSAQRYQRWVEHHLPSLVRDTDRLRTVVDDGDLATARRQWLTAHLDYQRLGAAYDAFGDLGEAIDGLPTGIPGGTHSGDWTGFHRVELDLWRGSSASRLVADVADLDRHVHRLHQELGTTQIDPLTLTLRAHEIVENALQFQLTGEDDFGSHTDLQSVRAELVGAGVVLGALQRPIEQRVAHPGQIRAAWRQTLTAFTRATRGGGQVAVDRLPRAERERLDASLSLLAERLAPIPATLEPRLTVASGRISGGAS
ncbi:MAG: EfeM/EfeO family lipoprotein [Nocardioides sp.]